MVTDVALLRLLLGPLLIGGASLAGRRWGPAVSGWIVGLPLTTGPVILLLALGQGPAFATTAALGTLAGGLALVTYGVAYSWLAQRWRWPFALALSGTLYLLVILADQQITIAPAPLSVVLTLLLIAALRVMPRVPPAGMQTPAATAPPVALPAWDLPARMVLAVGIVFGLSSGATWLGPRLTGLLATFPVYTTILATFEHHWQGAGGAARVMRGLIWGLFSFTGFYVVLCAALEPLGVAAAFALATAVALGVQFGALLLMRHKPQTVGDRPHV
jgi:hypothetical protein